MKIIYLEWNDAFCNAKWMTRNQMNEVVCDFDLVVRQAGFLVKETKKFLVFAGAWKPENKYDDEQFTDVHKIPKTWIRNRKTLTTVKG